MKKQAKCFLSIVCAMLTTLLCACSSSKAPDYSKYNDKFESYAYFSGLNGTHYIEGITYKDRPTMLTAEQYRIFKESGLTIYFPCQFVTYIDQNPTEEWKEVKTMLDGLVQEGVDKTIILDRRIVRLQWVEDTLIGEGKQFGSEQELDNKIEEYLSLYATYPGVYGVELGDEPKYSQLESYSEVYKSLKRVIEKNNYNLYIQYNLNPLNMSEYVFDNYYPHVEGTDNYNFNNCFIRYKKYIKDFLDAMQPDYVQYDDYPLTVNGIKNTFFPCLQFVCGEAKERNIDVHVVNQTYSMKVDNTQVTREKFGDEEARWLNNIMLAFGVKEIDYFTYFSPPILRTTGESYDNDKSLVDNDGKPTPLYYVMQKIIGENQKFAPTYFQFEYCASKLVKKIPMNYSTPYLAQFDNSQELTFVKNVSVDKEVALVTELKDDENDNVMISVVNILDPAKDEDGAIETVTLEFDSKKYKNALVYRNGVSEQVKLKSGKVSVTVKPGQASYVIPY